ncbi:MAG: 30S ribosomal protein S9 [Planctomycetes bacterium]|nr:30S ribosomal protein S9 [Planctomycetota bacterium]
MEETRNPTALEADGGVDLEAAEVLVEPEPEVDPTGRVVELGPKQFHWGTGRRKSARARVRLRPGSGDFVVNGKPMAEYFPRQLDQNAAMGALKSVGVEGKVDVYVNAEGGGITGQAGSVLLGISRALLKLYPDSYQRLRDAGHLTRDPRMVERKKYGLAGARRAFQWVKR